jgi:NADH pyrophosphatase NudC (nudix superfamily)
LVSVDAKWFSKEEIISALAEKNPNLRLPPSYAIAHSLIKSWASLEDASKL